MHFLSSVKIGGALDRSPRLNEQVRAKVRKLTMENRWWCRKRPNNPRVQRTTIRERIQRHEAISCSRWHLVFMLRVKETGMSFGWITKLMVQGPHGPIMLQLKLFSSLTKVPWFKLFKIDLEDLENVDWRSKVWNLIRQPSWCSFVAKASASAPPKTKPFVKARRT